MPDLDRIEQVRAIAKALWFLPKHWQAPKADGLYGLGVRLHPELESEQPDAEAAAQLAPLLWFLPPPAKRPLADGLSMSGLRVHPDLATKELITEGPAYLGNWRPQHLQNIGSREAVAANPEMADRLTDIVRRTNPGLADIIVNGTAEQKAAQRHKIYAEYGDKIDEIGQRLANVRPEDLE